MPHTSMKVAARRLASYGEAVEHLKIYLENPDREGTVFLQHYGLTTFREEGLKMGYSYRELKDLIEDEKSRIRSFSPDEMGLRGYLRLRRVGSRYPMNRKMRVGLFLMMVAEGFLRPSKSGKRASMSKVALRLRQMERLLDMGGDFGILSAYGPFSKKVNQQRHGQLVAELQRRGYRRFTNLKGSWEGVAEKALLVPNMSYKDLFDLGRRFNQVSVIYKNIDGIIGMYYLRDSTAEIAVDPSTNEAAYQISMNNDLYSKSRDLSFEFDFLWGQKVPWNGRTPIHSRQVKRFFNEGLLEAA